MAVRRLSAALLALCAGPAFGQGPVAELPPLLAPPAAIGPPTGLDACAPCRRPGDYVPGHAYLPAGNPDCRRPGGGCAAAGCGGECDRCRRAWVDGEFLYAHTKDLGPLGRDEAYGFKAGGGYWFDDSRTFGARLGFLNLTDPVREIIAGPTLVDAPLTITTADLTLRAELWTADAFRLDGIAGYRYLQLHERLRGGMFRPAQPPARFDLADRNQVHAGELGLIGHYQVGNYFAEVAASLSVGQNSMDRKAFGVARTGSELSLIPDVAGRVGYQIGEGTWLTLGYTFLLVSNVARPGLPDSQTFYLHGGTVGLEFRF